VPLRALLTQVIEWYWDDCEAVAADEARGPAADRAAAAAAADADDDIGESGVGTAAPAAPPSAARRHIVPIEGPLLRLDDPLAAQQWDQLQHRALLLTDVAAVTDAPLLYTPSQIAAACLLLATTAVVDAPLPLSAEPPAHVAWYARRFLELKLAREPEDDGGSADDGDRASVAAAAATTGGGTTAVAPPKGGAGASPAVGAHAAPGKIAAAVAAALAPAEAPSFAPASANRLQAAVLECAELVGDTAATWRTYLPLEYTEAAAASSASGLGVAALTAGGRIARETLPPPVLALAEACHAALNQAFVADTPAFAARVAAARAERAAYKAAKPEKAAALEAAAATGALAPGGREYTAALDAELAAKGVGDGGSSDDRGAPAGGSRRDAMAAGAADGDAGGLLRSVLRFG